jgi:hypothetical protein
MAPEEQFLTIQFLLEFGGVEEDMHDIAIQ